MARGARRQVETFHAVGRRDDRHRVRREIHVGSPTVGDFDPRQRRKLLRDTFQNSRDGAAARRWVKNAHPLEGRRFTLVQASECLRTLEEGFADAELHRFQTLHEHRHEPAGVANALRGDVEHRPAADRKRVAAIQPAGQRTLRRIDRFAQIRCRPRSKRRLAHARLRKQNSVLATKHGRPGTAGAENGLCPDGPLFGDHSGDRPIDQIEASRSALLVDRRSESASAVRDRRRGDGRLTLAVID